MKYYSLKNRINLQNNSHKLFFFRFFMIFIVFLKRGILSISRVLGQIMENVFGLR